MSDQPIFQRTLQDLIKGIRSHKKDSSQFISKCITEIKIELKCTDPFLKSEAVRKLTYLQMIGYNVSWASFSIVEVMSQQRFAHKRIGYLAANQSFNENTDVILLTTNLFKKEFSSSSANPYEVGLAINSIANIANQDLAKDCISDMVNLMNSSKTYIRKKAALAMLKLYMKFPQGLRLTFDKLKERLDDSDSSVVSTSVNVICELANKNPKNYLAMAPKFFRLLTTSSNNWMLIKVVKLLGSLVSEEPRLARKLLDPLATIIQNTGAKSLQYECINTATEALPFSTREDGTEAKNAPMLIELCSKHLRSFIEDSDQNLKYLGLVGLVKLMKSNPRSVIEHRDLILKCLNDEDFTIRTKSLELLAGIVSRKSLVELVEHLLMHAQQSEGLYRDEIISKILFMCRKEKYGFVSDFIWYISILLKLSKMHGMQYGKDVADQIIEICLRVDTVRPYAVEALLGLLFDNDLIDGPARLVVSEVLRAAAWILGEYSSILTLIGNDKGRDSLAENDDDDENSEYWIEGVNEEVRSKWKGQPLHVMVLDALTHPRVTNLPSHVQIVYIHSAMKFFIRSCCDASWMDLSRILSIVRHRFPIFLQSLELEVQDRSSTFRYLLAELNILPMNYEDIEQDMMEDSLTTPHNKKFNAPTTGNLVKFSNGFSYSIKKIDENGATLAKEKSSILLAGLGEAFFPVHPKAQRRVLQPDELKLDAAWNTASLNNLLSTELPENLLLNNLYFIHGNKLSGDFTKMPNVFSDENIDKKSDGMHPDGKSMVVSVSTGLTSKSNGSSSSSHQQDGEVFMLNGESRDGKGMKFNASSKEESLLKILGEHSDPLDMKDSKVRRKKHEKSKKKGNVLKKEVILPSGGRVDSSDDDEMEWNALKSKQKVNKKNLNESKENELSRIDLITPLRKEEVLEVSTHRVVSEGMKAPSHRVGQEMVVQSNTLGIEKKKEKKSHKHGKDTKGSISETKLKMLDKPRETESNLLGLDMSPMTAVSHLEVRRHDMDLLGLTMESSSSALQPASLMMGNSSSSSSSSHAVDSHSANKTKSSSKKNWSPLYSDQHVLIQYCPIIPPTKGDTQRLAIKLHMKIKSQCKKNDMISVKMVIHSSSWISSTLDSNQSIILSENLPYNEETKKNVEVELLNATQFLSGLAGIGSIPIQCTFDIALQSTKRETYQHKIIMKVPITASFTSHAIDYNALEMMMMMNNPLSWINSSCTIPLSNIPKDGKYKSIFKMLAGYLHAAIVESTASSSDNAVTMCAKTVYNDTVLYLVKPVRSGAAIYMDVKCMKRNGNEQISRNILEAIVHCLPELNI